MVKAIYIQELSFHSPDQMAELLGTNRICENVVKYCRWFGPLDGPSSICICQKMLIH